MSYSLHHHTILFHRAVIDAVDVAVVVVVEAEDKVIGQLVARIAVVVAAAVAGHLV